MTPLWTLSSLSLAAGTVGSRHPRVPDQTRTYQVCFDCGREFDLPDTLGAASAEDSYTTSLP
jgi:hypothetical protein